MKQKFPASNGETSAWLSKWHSTWPDNRCRRFLLKGKKPIFLIPSLGWPKMKHLVVFFDKIFQIAFCLTRSKKMTREILIFQICFWPLSVEFFWLLASNFGKAVKNVINASKRVFWRDGKFWENYFVKVIFRFWVWSRNFLTLGINFCMILETEVQVTTGLFSRKRMNQWKP